MERDVLDAFWLAKSLFRQLHHHKAYYQNYYQIERERYYQNYAPENIKLKMSQATGKF